MKNISVGVLLSLLALNASAGYMYMHKNDEGKVIFTSDQEVIDKIEADRKAKNQTILDERRKQARQLASKPSAAIGMTKEQVRNKTNWGEPNSINTTTNKYGTHEQWVYGDYQYLYFDNGKLTTIQQ